jgi:hypothetical protein
VTSNGGALKIEARDLVVGLFNPDTGGVRSGNVQSSGGVPSKIEIGFTDDTGAQQTHTVTINGINTNGLKQNEKDKPVEGGDVAVNATVWDHAAAHTTRVRPARTGSPDLAGGSVRITSGSTIRLGVSTVVQTRPISGPTCARDHAHRNGCDQRRPCRVRRERACRRQPVGT